MNPIVTTPPVGYPVTLAEVRLQLGLDSEDFDPRLAGLVAAATEHIETLTGRALLTRSYKGYLNWWPYDSQNNGVVRRYVALERPPLVSVQSVITYDDNDVPTVLDPSLYYVDTARTLGRVVLRRGKVWPIPLRVANGIEINWTAGYGSAASDVPEPLRLAVQLMVGFLNEHRGDETFAVEEPRGVTTLIAPYRIWPPA